MSTPALGDRDAAAIAAGLAAVAVVLSGPLSGDTLFIADFSYIHHPLLKWSAKQLTTGALPTWNPDVGLGLPQLANPILGTLYPPCWLLAFLPVTTGLNLLLGAHVALALVTAWRLLRALGAPAWPALLGSAAFALGGPLLSSLMYAYPVLAWAWPALAAEGAVRLGREAWQRPMALIALGTGMSLLAGDPMACGVAATLALLLAGPASSDGGRRRRGALALGGVALGLALAAAQIAPTLALLPHSVRAAADAGASGTWSFSPERLLGFVQPAHWGRQWPELSYWGWYLSETRLNDGNFFYPSHFIGVVPLLLAPLAVAAPTTRRIALTLLLAAAVALLLSFGRNLPLHGWLLEHLPGFGAFRYPEKWVLPATLALALTGGLGLTKLGRTHDGGTWAAAALALLAICGSIAVLAADDALRATIGGRSPVPNVDAARAAQIAGAILTGVAAATVLAAMVMRRARPYAPTGLALVALAEVVAGNWGLAPSAPAGLFDAPARTLVLLNGPDGSPVTRVERHDGLNRVALHKDLQGLTERYRSQLATLRANAVLEAGRKRVGAETPARLAHAVQPEDWLWADPGRAAPILGAELLLVAGERPPATVRSDPTLGPRSAIPELGVVALAPARPVLPDVFCIESVTPTSTGDVRAHLLARDPSRSAVVEPSHSLGPAASLDALATAAPSDAWPCARWTAEPGAFHIDVTLERPALLVVRDSWAPGWAAEADQALPIVRTYGSLKGIPLPAGTHRVELRYTAPGLLPGAVLSGLAALGLIALWWKKR